MTKIALVLLFLFLSVVFASESVAETDNDDSDVKEREVKVELNGGEAQIELKSKNPTREDQLHLKLRTDESESLLRAEFEYKSEAASSEIELKYHVSITELIEFTDAGNDNSYAAGVDTVVSTYTPPKSFNPWVSQQVNTTAASLFKLTGQATDGVLTFIATVTTTQVTDGGFTYDPNACKIDVIVDYPFSSTSTKLALVGILQSDSEKEHDDINEGDKDDEIEIHNPVGSKHSTTANGGFDWERTVEGDNSAVINVHNSVNRTKSGDGNRYQIIWVFENQASHYIWDPQLKVTYGSASLLSSWITIFLSFFF